MMPSLPETPEPWVRSAKVPKGFRIGFEYTLRPLLSVRSMLVGYLRKTRADSSTATRELLHRQIYGQP